MNEVALIVLLIIVAIVAIFVIPQWFIKRSIPKVIKIFRENRAIDIKNAKTVNELGLRPYSMLERLFRRRDYKQYALNALVQAGIIQKTEDGKLYLSEEKLGESRLEKPTSYIR